MSDDEALADTQKTTQTQSQTQTDSQSQSQSQFEAPATWGRLLAAPLPPSNGNRTLGTLRTSRPHEEIPPPIDSPIDLVNDQFLFGRASYCDFRVTAQNTGEKLCINISKEHFIIKRDLSGHLNPVILYDFSFNGTYVNGQKVGKNNLRILETNDLISVTNSTSRMFLFIDLFKNEQGQVPQILSKKYFISRTLGVGACGTVKLVYNKMTGEKFALKIILKGKTTFNKKFKFNDPTKIKNEIDILCKIKHPFIITTEEVYDLEEGVYIILEYMEGGELFDLVSSEKRMPESFIKYLFRQIILAVKHLHDNRITHRDLKPENVLLESKDSNTRVKLTDFGLSKFITEESYMKTLCGTPLYVAPEVLLCDGTHKSYNSQVDVWSLGVILFICLAGYLPFSQDYKRMSLRDQIIKGHYIYSKPHWQGISRPAKILVRKMLNVDPNKRITLVEILNSEWMQDDDVIKRTNDLLESSVTEPCSHIITELTTTVNIISSVTKRDLSEVSKINDPPAKRRRISSSSSSQTTTSTSSEDTLEATSIVI